MVNRIYDALCRLEKMANFYDPASELSILNRTASVSPVVLSEELYSMIDLCLEYNGRTWDASISQFIRRITTRTLYIQYIYLPEIVVSLFHSRE